MIQSEYFDTVLPGYHKQSPELMINVNGLDLLVMSLKRVQWQL